MSISFLHPHLPFPTTKPTLKTLNSTHKHPKFHPITSLKTSTNPSQNPITTLTKILWPKTLPPQLLISTVRSIWTSTWQLMMSQLAPSDPTTGSYSRPTSQFRAKTSQLSRQNSKNTLHLYVGLPCPWAHRTLIVRALKGLEDDITVSIAAPGVDGLWVFVENGGNVVNGLAPGRDNVNGCKSLKEVYKLRNGGYNGRSTVPMLWDVKKRDVVCNESYDIIQLLNDLVRNEGFDLEPIELKARIEEWNSVVYPNVNNGVYRLLSLTYLIFDSRVGFNTLLICWSLCYS